MNIFRNLFGNDSASKKRSTGPRPEAMDPAFWEQPVPIHPDTMTSLVTEDEVSIALDYISEAIPIQPTNADNFVRVSEATLKPFDPDYLRALKMPGMLSVTELWTGYVTWLEVNVPSLYVSLNRPATDADFASFERAAGFAVPADLQELYRCNNGGQSINGVLDYDFNSLELLLSTYLDARDGTDNFDSGLAPNSTGGSLPVEDDFAVDTHRQIISVPVDAVATVRQNAKWLAWLSDGAGNNICVDLAAGASGQLGQVIDTYRDSPQRKVLAWGVNDFLRQFLLHLAFGNYELDVTDDIACLSLGTETHNFSELFSASDCPRD